MRRVRCPKCANIIEAQSDLVTCNRCGLTGNIGAGKKDGDPWTITIDLRNLRPKNWSPATRSTMMFLLLVGVFFAGGMSGMVFERTRLDFSEDLASADLFGGNDSSQSTVEGLNPDGTVANPNQPVTGDTGGSDPAGDPSGDPDADSDPDAGSAPDAGSDPDAGSGQPTGSTQYLMTLNGPGKKTFSDIPAQAGLYRLDIEFYDDTHAFELSVTTPSGTSLARLGSPQNWGDYQAVRYIGLEDGVIDIHVGARTGGWDGDWTVKVYLVGHETGKKDALSASGTGDQGLGPVAMDGAFTLAFRTSDKMYGQILIQAFTASGDPVPGCTVTQQVTGSSPYDGQVACDLTAPATVYIDVAAPEPSPASAAGWTLSIT